jgi:hypothetical protein
LWIDRRDYRTHREHVVCNPTSEEKLTRLVELLRLPAGARVVDIACGKGEFLIRFVKPGGSVIVGEPYWLQEPSQDYLEASGVAREDSRASGEGQGGVPALGARHAWLGDLHVQDTFCGPLRNGLSEGASEIHGGEPKDGGARGAEARPRVR